MYRILCSLLALAVLALVAPRSATAAGPVTVQISAAFPNGPAVSATASGTPLVGVGKLNTYALRITGGSVRGRYVTLTGVIVAGGGQTTAFQLDAEVTTGTVRLVYKGANGATFTFIGKGQVLVSG